MWEFVGKRITWWMIVLMVIPLVGMVVVAATLSARIQRRRRREVAERLGALGFTVNLKPSDEDRAAFLAPLKHLEPALDLQKTPGGLEWHAHRDTPGGRIVLFEYEYITGSGKSAQHWVRTVVALPGSMSGFGAAGGLTVSRLPWLHRRAFRKYEMKHEGLAGFAKDWAVYGDPGTAELFLTAEVRAELARSPKNESWVLGGGWACCSFREYLNAQNLVTFMERALRLLTPAGLR